MDDNQNRPPEDAQQGGQTPPPQEQQNFFAQKDDFFTKEQQPLNQPAGGQPGPFDPQPPAGWPVQPFAPQNSPQQPPTPPHPPQNGPYGQQPPGAFYPPQSPPYGQPAPGQYGAPPYNAPMPGPYGQPPYGQQPPPPKKRRTGCIVAAIVVAVVGILAVVGFAALIARETTSARPPVGYSAPRAYSAPAPAQHAPPNFEQTLLFEQDDVKVTAIGFEDTGFGPELQLRVENSSGQDITLMARDCAVNNFMVMPVFSCEASAGATVESIILFPAVLLNTNDIGIIHTVQLRFDAVDTDSWNGIFATDLITLTPGEGDAPQSSAMPGTVIFEEGGVAISYKEVLDDDYFGKTIEVCIKNETQQNITVQVDEMLVNGQALDPVFSCDVTQGNLANDSIILMQEDLDDAGIEEIQTIEVSFDIFDLESYDDITITPTIEITP